VTVLDQGTYVGEAMLDTLKPGETRLVGYAVELAVRVTDSIDTITRPVSRVVIQGGTLKAASSIVQQTTYTFASTAAGTQTAYVDHPRPGGDWILLEPAKAHEITENFWRFKVTVGASQTTRLVIRSEQPRMATYRLLGAHDAEMQAWINDRWIDAATAETLNDAFALRRQFAGFKSLSQELAAERSKLHDEQARIRDNLKSLNELPTEKDLRQRYIRTLTAQEDRLESIAKEAAKSLADASAVRDELEAKMAAISFTGTVN
jgi:hypothetical protein